MAPILLRYLIFALIGLTLSTHAFWHKARDYTPLEDEDLQTLATTLPNDVSDAILDYHNPTSLLAKILIPRPPGSQNLTDVHNLIRKHFASLSSKPASPSGDPFSTWEKFEDVFTADTPYGEKEFTNLVFTHNPMAQRKLVVAAHTDSKYFVGPPQNGFVGATDSAVPCAIMLEVASALTPLLDAAMTGPQSPSTQPSTGGTTLQFVFFDGEEAFKQWTSTDSIYGARWDQRSSSYYVKRLADAAVVRHLADLWSSPSRTPSPTSPQRSAIAEISDFILLDLLGAANPVIRNFFQETGWLYDAMVDAENRLGEAGHLWKDVSGEQWATQSVKGSGSQKSRSFFVKRKNTLEVYGGHIEDDHLPFLRRGVPILHIIPVPFPGVWHTLADNASALDLPTIQVWAKIIRVLVAEYLQLGSSIDDASKLGKRDELASLAVAHHMGGTKADFIVVEHLPGRGRYDEQYVPVCGYCMRRSRAGECRSDTFAAQTREGVPEVVQRSLLL